MGWFKDDKPKAPAEIDPATGKPKRGFFGRYADRVHANQDAATAKAEEDRLANTTPVAPPPTSLIASQNVDLARAAAERQRKRGAGSLLTPGTGQPGPKAKLQPKTLIGGY